MSYSENDMKPVRHGKLYCAPFCGRGCTYAEYQTAARAASKLAKRMGSGWKPYVHENLGWHWHVVSDDGLLSVHRSRDTYTASLGDGRFIGFGKTTAQALAAVESHTRIAFSYHKALLAAVKRFTTGARP